ncbi:acyltransferase family protein [Phenylobacterium sp.]|uniref:acyltransferase family protein n=1 Tax=Phenylobacterium sp. TaxID=1871053 RepID=UPI003783D72F
MRQHTPPWAAGSGNIPGLDGLRAISILIVMASHLITDRIPGGLGVYVFFVISGFLIAHLMFSEAEKTGRVSLRKFYLRRALRLYPALIVYVLVTTLYCVAVGFAISGTDVASALLYFANYHKSQPFGIIWSLSVEEHFYILFPSLVVLLRANAKAVAVAALLVCLGCLALRLAVGSLEPQLAAAGDFYNHTQYRLDSIAFGVLIAAVYRTSGGHALLRPLSHPLCGIVALLTVLACLIFRDPYFRETIRYSLLGLSIAVILVGVLFRPTAPTRLLDSAPLVWIGKLSYSLYLWHYFVKFGFVTLFPETSVVVYAPLLTALSFAFAAASYYWLERPMQALRKALNPADPKVAETRSATVIDGLAAPSRMSEAPARSTEAAA